MKPVIPYLTFYGNGKEAAAFYQETLGLENQGMQTYGESDYPSPPEAADYLLHCHLSNGAFSLMLADSANPGDSGAVNVALVIDCESEEEINRLYSELQEGGTAVMELQDTFWGAKYGKLRDKFGYTWDLNFEKAQVE
jgi:PhnB protein